MLWNYLNLSGFLEINHEYSKNSPNFAQDPLKNFDLLT